MGLRSVACAVRKKVGGDEISGARRVVMEPGRVGTLGHLASCPLVELITTRKGMHSRNDPTQAHKNIACERRQCT